MRRENLLDIEYVNRDGDSMRGPLALAGEPILGAHAATKRYIDTVLANLRTQVIARDGSLPMLGPLLLSGAPALGLHATSKNYVDAEVAAVIIGFATTIYVDAGDAAERVYSDAQDALRLLLAGGTMGGDLTLAGAPTNALHATPMNYVDTADALRLLLAGGTMGGVLELAGAPVNPLEAATKDYVDTAIPAVSLNTYDAVVAAAGGDYTSVVAACAGEAAGARIFVKSGTYNETADIILKDGQMLVGENPDDTIIDFGAANRKLTNPGGCTNQAVMDLTFQGAEATYTVDLQGDHARVDNCRLFGNAGASYEGLRIDGSYGTVTRCLFDGFSRASKFSVLLGPWGTMSGSFIINADNGVDLGDHASAVGCTFRTLGGMAAQMAEYSVLIGNICEAADPVEVLGDGCVVESNLLYGGDNVPGSHDYIRITANAFYLSDLVFAGGDANMNTITGNAFVGGDGVSVNGYSFTISGNSFQGAAHITLIATAKNCLIVGNNLDYSTEPADTRIDDIGLNNTARDNLGVPVTLERTFLKMKNTSGGALVPGDVVVLKAVAIGSEITTTVNQGDDMVFGMLEDNIGNTAFGEVQTIGKTAKLKVNGVVNIAIGDLLGTFTAAGISMKAASGDMAFAIALEVYAGADSNGIIDALLVSPRKI